MQIFKYALILSFFFATSTHAAPTVEGLLRGGHNPENIYDWSVYRLRVKKKKMVTIDAEGVVKDAEAVNQEDVEQADKFETKHIKIIFSTKIDRPVQFIQVEYASAAMKKDEVINVIHSRDLLKKFSEESFQERILFYGVLLSLSSGNSSVMSNLLAKFNKDFKSNRDLLNKEKLDLYDDYKKYLVALKNNPDLEKTAESPLRPVEVTKLSETQKIIKQDMYQDLKQVNIFKEGNRFFWKAKLENFEGVFTLDKHYLRKLSLTTPQGVINLGASHYRVFSSNFYLPGILKLKDVIEESYEIEIKQYQQFGRTEVSLTDLLKNYEVDQNTQEKDGVTKVELKTTSDEAQSESQDVEIKEKFNILISDDFSQAL